MQNNSVFEFSGGTLKYGNSLGSSPPDFSNRFTSASGQNLRSIRISTVIFSNPIEGSANSLEKLGSGTLILSGANNYSGTTKIQEGVLISNTALGGDIVFGSGNGVLKYGSNLSAATDFSPRFTSQANQIFAIDTMAKTLLSSEFGSAGSSLVKLGEGSLTLNSSVANDLPGGVTFAGGELIVDSSKGVLGSSGVLSFTGGHCAMGPTIVLPTSPIDSILLLSTIQNQHGGKILLLRLHFPVLMVL